MAVHFLSEKFHLVLTSYWWFITNLFFHPINMSSTWRHKLYWFWLIFWPPEPYLKIRFCLSISTILLLLSFGNQVRISHKPVSWSKKQGLHRSPVTRQFSLQNNIPILSYSFTRFQVFRNLIWHQSWIFPEGLKLWKMGPLIFKPRLGEKRQWFVPSDKFINHWD